MVLGLNSKFPGVAAGKTEQLAVCDFCLIHALAINDSPIFEKKIASKSKW